MAPKNLEAMQRYTYRVLQTIQMNLMLLQVWAEWAVLGRAKTALEFTKPQNLGSLLMNSSQSNFDLRAPSSFLVRS